MFKYFSSLRWNVNYYSEGGIICWFRKNEYSATDIEFDMDI